jgi:hypothetical protein
MNIVISYKEGKGKVKNEKAFDCMSAVDEFLSENAVNHFTVDIYPPVEMLYDQVEELQSDGTDPSELLNIINLLESIEQ